MNDWKKNIDDYQKQQELLEEEARKKGQQEAKKRETEEAIQLNEDRMKHLAKFKCHIHKCKKHGNIPLEYEYEHDDGWGPVFTDSATTWDWPGNILKCSICGKWTCTEDHLHEGICKKCGEKM